MRHALGDLGSGKIRLHCQTFQCLFSTAFDVLQWGFQGCFYDSSDSLTRILNHPWEKTPLRTCLIIAVAVDNSWDEGAERLRMWVKVLRLLVKFFLRDDILYFMLQ